MEGLTEKQRRFVESVASDDEIIRFLIDVALGDEPDRLRPTPLSDRRESARVLAATYDFHLRDEEIVERHLSDAMTIASGPVGLGGQGVYLMQFEPETVKIGVTNDAEARRRSLQTGLPRRLKILGVISGKDHRDEALIHDAFSEFRLEGEWFRVVGPVAEFVSTVSGQVARDLVMQAAEVAG